jgi:LacI family transcriptional regulator, galactose operon repressor
MDSRAKHRSAPVRMKDIARDLGLSVVTVSKVFRGGNDIGEQTRQRVLDRMAELHYRPNLAARSLATGRSFTMGFVVPDLVHPFFSEVAQHLADELRPKGYSLFISSSREEPTVEQEEIEHLLARQVEVLIVASSRMDGQELRAMASRQQPLILVDRQISGLAAHFVGVDDELTGVLATEHLLEQGCRSIAHITAPSVSTARGRLAGYHKALSAAAHPVRPDYLQNRPHGDHNADESGYLATKRLLALDPRPDGVFCYNDPTAMGTMRAILEAGLRIPEDIAVVGCGNAHYSEFLRVPLTTIDQNCAGIGQKAARLALDLLASSKRRQPRTILLKQRLIVRESSLRLKAKRS